MGVRAWIARACSQDGEPSSKRLVHVFGLACAAPLLLAGALLKTGVTEAWATAFAAYVVSVGGSYAVSRFAEKNDSPAGGGA